MTWRRLEWQKQREDELRKVKGQLYLDVVEYVHNQQAALNNVIESFELSRSRAHNPIPDLQHRERLEARLTLYGDGPIRLAWQRVQHAQNRLNNEYEQAGAPDFSPKVVDEMRGAIEELRQLARRDLEGTSA